MSIESYLSLNDACRIVPGRDGPGVSIATIWRWMLKGIKAPNGRRVTLRSYKLGGRRVTTRVDLERFIAELNAPAEPVAAAPFETPAKRKRRQATAERECEAVGL